MIFTKQTGTYNLSQWESSDRIMREDFNADNAKIDAALAEAVAASPYVKIKEVTLTSDVTSYSLDVSDVDFTQYWNIELFCDAATPLSLVALRVNGITTGYRYGNTSGGGSGYDSTASSLGSLGGRTLFYQPVAGVSIGCCYFRGASNNSFTGQQYVAPCTWDELVSFDLSRTTVLPAGTKISLFGLKK